MKNLLMVPCIFLVIPLFAMEKQSQTVPEEKNKITLDQLVQIPFNELSQLKPSDLRTIIRAERGLDKEDNTEGPAESTLQKRLEELRENCKRQSSVSKNAYRKANKEARKNIKVVENILQMIGSERERRKKVKEENEALRNTPYGFRISYYWHGSERLSNEQELSGWTFMLEDKTNSKTNYDLIKQGICTIIAATGSGYVNFQKRRFPQDSYPLLWYAVQHNDLDFVIFLCNRGADMNWKDEYKHPLLLSILTSTNAQSVELAQYFLENGADLSWKDGWGNTLLHLLVKEKYETDYSGTAEEICDCIVKKTAFLLNADIDLEAKDIAGHSVEDVLNEKLNHHFCSDGMLENSDVWCWRCKGVMWLKEFKKKFSEEREKRKSRKKS